MAPATTTTAKIQGNTAENRRRVERTRPPGFRQEFARSKDIVGKLD
jgi:hypothetical protein